ncbi:MAG: S41 family peptidase [Pseudorhodoplanes sp.]|nr:S41 family peptidase [Pseudorhodoplanes sp.]
MKRAILWIALVFLLPLPAAAQTGATDFKALNLFGDIFERIRSDFADESKVHAWALVDAAVAGLIKAGGETARAGEIAALRSSRYKETAGGNDSAQTYNALNYFGDVFDLLRNKDGAVADALMSAAISEMLRQLDRHSSYMTAKEFRDMQVLTRGDTGGAGLEIFKAGDQVKVVRPIPGSQAERAGIACGDVIVAIDGAPVASLDLSEVAARLRGPVNSKVVLSVSVAGRPRPFDLTVERKVVYRAAVDYEMRDDIGYLRINSFDGSTKERMERVVAEIKSKIPAARLNGYVIDLRGNSGGLFDAIVATADLFLDRGEILSTRGRGTVQRYAARPGDIADRKPIAVLIDGGTASGAELFAAALRDHNRGKLVGRRSLGGAGAIQTVIPLGAGNGVLRLTTSHMYSPRGNLIADGLVPDITVEGVPDAKEDCAAQGGDASRDMIYRRGAEVVRQSQARP